MSWAFLLSVTFETQIDLTIKKPKWYKRPAHNGEIISSNLIRPTKLNLLNSKPLNHIEQMIEMG